MPTGSSTTVAYAPRFYPTLASVLEEDQIPDILGFVKDGIFLIFNKIHYKNLQYHKSAKGDAAFYSLSLIAKERIDVEIPGTGIYLVLNPDIEGADDAISVFPITVEYEWKVLAYLRSFSHNQFDFTPRAFFEIALRVLQISEEQALANFINIFSIPPDNTVTPLQQFVADINTHTGLTLSTPDDNTTLSEITRELYAQTQQYATEIAFGTYILSNGVEDTKDKLRVYFKSFIPEDIETFIKDILIPKFRATLQLNAAVEFPRKLLQPVYPDGHPNAYQVIPENPNDAFPDKVLLSFGEALFYADTTKGFGYNMDIVLNTVTPAMIGKTGLIINLQHVKIDLSQKENIAEADLDGRPNDFMGVYVGEGTITLPPKWFKSQPNTTAQIYARNLLIGTGGMSGNIGLEAHATTPPAQGVAPELQLKLGSDDGFVMALNRFNVAFQQGAILSSDIKGSITIPGFKEFDAQGNKVSDDLKLDIMMTFDDDGDFSITASDDSVHRNLGIEDVFYFDMETFTVGKEDERHYIAVTGGLHITADLGNLEAILPSNIEIERLIIWEDGSFEIAVDTPPLPQEIRVKFGPVDLYVSNLHIGSYEKNGRPYKYFGFDGGIDTTPTSVDARGTGVKLYFSVDDGPLDIFIRIQRLEVDLIIPAGSSPETAALLLNGYLALRESDGGTTEYAGGIDITLPKLNLRGSAAMRLNPQRPSFIVDAQMEMKKGVPLGTTGLAIYGFRGLVGQNYVATKQAAGITEADPWWKYYKAEQPTEGIHVEKFEDKDGFSLGAGVSLATAADEGFKFSSKLFFLLSLPNVFLFEGKAGVLQQRIGLAGDDEPPFFAFLAVDDTSVEAALGVDYYLPREGVYAEQIAHLYGIMELGFFHGNASAWYINVGRDLPEDMRVQANVLDLFHAYAYLMLSAKRIKVGAGVNFERDYKFGPVRLDLSAYMDVAAEVNFRPQQFGGSLALGGSVAIKVFGVGLGFAAHALLAGETPKPYIIIGKFGVEFRVIKKFKFEVALEWTRDPNHSDAELPIMTVTDTENLPVKATHILTKTTYPLTYSNSLAIPSPQSTAWSGVFDEYIIPMDSFIDMEFAKAVKPFTQVAQGNANAKLGGVTTGYQNTEVYPPLKAKTTPLRHTYEVEAVSIKYWTGTQWENYDIYEALTALTDLPFIDPQDLTNKKHGYWQMQTPEQYNKLRLLAQTPISYLTQTANPTPLEEFGISYQSLFCEDVRIENYCHRWEEEPVGTAYTANQIIAHKMLQWQANQNTTVANSGAAISPALQLVDAATLTFFFFQTAAEVNLKLLTDGTEVTIKYYKRVQQASTTTAAPTMTWQLVHQVVKTKADLSTVVAYQNVQDGIDKVEIIIPTPPANHPDAPYNPSYTFVQEVCWQTVDHYLFNQTIVDNTGVQAEATALIEGLNKVIQPIWRPNTEYVIQLKVVDRLSQAHDKVYETYHNYGFKTAGPIGHFHLHDTAYSNLPAAQKDQYRIADLRSYVDYSKSYPNADGNLLSAKPLFYEHPKLNLFFIKPYVYTMFNDFGAYLNTTTYTSKLKATIRDPADQPISAVQGTQQTTARWFPTNYGVVASDVQVLNNLIVNGQPCVQTTQINPPNVAAELIPDTLKPRKTYTAIIESEFEEAKAEVLRYVFETSRYPDFKAQVESYILSAADNKKAIYNLVLDNVNTAKMQQVIADTLPDTDILRRDFAHPFDRLLYTLGLKALEVPMTTEFNIVRFDEDVLGVLVRSPEPFNDPKIPNATIISHLNLFHPDISPQDFRVIISKDGASLFITSTDFELSDGELQITLPYLEFDGQQYLISANLAHQAPVVRVEI